ncbi:MAG: glycogen synthase [Lachnospiraceae bacterium]|nr:glycogen synthase [Lachnospiraceae bacterium]
MKEELTKKTDEAIAAAEKAAKKPAAKKTASKKATVKKEAAAEAEAKAEDKIKEEKPAVKKTAAKKPAVKKAAAEAVAGEEKAVKKPAAKKSAAKKAASKEEAAEAKTEKKAAAKKPAAKKTAAKKAPAKKAEPAEEKKIETIVDEALAEAVAEVEADVTGVTKAEEIVEEAAPAAEAAATEETAEAAPVEEGPQEEAQPALPEPRRSVAFIGSECYPFVKTGGLGDVMYALPKALIDQNCDVKVILPRYKCIPQEYQDKMVYRGAFEMNLCSDGRSFYVGIMEYVWDGIVYDFIDNEEFFSSGNPYTNLVDDIPKFCYFGKAALAALNYMDWIPDVIHCHDWQAGLVPVYLRTMFDQTPLARSKVMLTIHNLRFQGIYDMSMIKYWSGLPDYVFTTDVMTQNWKDANMLKAGLTYCNMITTVSNTYAGEIQTPFFGENLDAHLRFHSGKLRGVINGIETKLWDPAADDKLAAPYSTEDAIEKKKANKLALQEALGLEQDSGKYVIGLISRLTNQKGLDLINAIIPDLVDGNTQIVVLGTGDSYYEDAFRYYENVHKGTICSNIMFDETRAHMIYAGADALLVPSLFEPCGLTQLIAMHYGTVPIVRETGGLKDTVQPFNEFTNEGNGFSFDRYDAGLLLDAVNRSKTVYFTQRERWDEMVIRDMQKDVSWENSAKQYRDLYLELTW